MEEVVEQAIDSAADVVVGRTFQPKLSHLAVVSAVALGAGAGLTWLVAKRHFERVVEEQRLEARAFYANLYKKEQFPTPGDALEALGRSETVADAAEALNSYKGDGAAVGELVVVEEEVNVEVTPIVRSRNIFEQNRNDLVWDQDAEEAYRETIGEGEPYIICQKEALENENDYEQKTLTYFVEDQVLVDEKDQPIELIDTVVGEENLTRFGHGTTDDNAVLIRNDKLSMDFEVIRHEGSYAKEVLGFQHSEQLKMRHPNRRPITDIDD